MRISNEDKLTLDFKNTYTDKEMNAIVMIGTEDNENDNRIGVYVPKLMLNITAPNGAMEVKEEVDLSKLANTKNKDIGSKSIYVRNYTMCMPLSLAGESVSHIAKGENVSVKFLDQDINTLYMMPHSMFNSHKRKQDRKVSFVPATPEEQTPLDETNTYRIVKDSMNKMILIETAKANGEDYVYRILIDAKNNQISMNDGLRRVDLISDEDVISIQNEAGTSLTAKGGKLDIRAEDINILAKNKIRMKANIAENRIDTQKDFIDTYKGEIKKSQIKGKKLKMDYDKTEYKGNIYEGEFKKVIYKNTPLFGIDGTLTSEKWYTGTKAGKRPTPANAGGGTDGGFDMAAVGSQPVAIAKSVAQALNVVGQNVDIVYSALMGVGPTIPILTVMAPDIPSKKLRG